MVTKKLQNVRTVQRVPKSRRIDVTRAEFDRAIDLLNQRGELLNNLRVNQDIQLTRIAQIQAELDRLSEAIHELRRMSEKV